MNENDEKLEILRPPLFEPTGEVKTREQVYRDGDWVGTFNLWVVAHDPEPAIIYQQRSLKKSWAPGLLDVTAGGHLLAGERLIDGLREVEEELGRRYEAKELTYLGRKLYVGFNANGAPHNNIVSIYLIEDSTPLSLYILQPEEVYALCICPVRELLKAHRNSAYRFTARGLTAAGASTDIEVSKASFPQNYDDYHYKIAILADRYFKGEKDLLY